MFSTIEVLGTTTSSSGINIAVGDHRLFYLSNEYTGTFFSKELLNAKPNKKICAQFVGTGATVYCSVEYIDANTIKLASDGTHSVSLYSLD